VFDTLRADLRHARRLLGARPGFTAIAVLTLAIGIGANTAIFSVVFGVLLSPLDFHAPDRLAILWRSNAEQATGNYPVPAPEYLDWTAQNRSFDRTAAVRQQSAVLTGTDEPERLIGAAVTAGLFPLLGTAPALGRGLLEEENQTGRDEVVVLSDGLWSRRFAADSAVIGRQVELDGQRRTVIGVMPPGFTFPGQSQFWTPLVFSPEQLADRDWHFLLMIARLRDGVTFADAQRDMSAIGARLAAAYPETNEGWAAVVQPLMDAVVGNVRTTIWVLFGAVTFVLLIACLNVANLLLTQAAGRQRELCIRAALGAGMGRLVRQLLVESVLLSLIGGTAGLGLAFFGLETLSTATGSLPRAANVSINGTVLLFTVGLAVVTGVLFGLLPAWQARRIDLTEGLKEGSRGAGLSGRRSRLGRVLVTSEIAVAMVLVVGAGLMVQSFRYLMGVDPGFQAGQVLTARVALPQARYPAPERIIDFTDRLRARVGALPGVTRVAVAPFIPMAGGGPQFRYRLASDPVGSVNDMPVGAFSPVSPDFFETMGIPVAAGRTFGGQDARGQPAVVIVNEAFVRRHFPSDKAIGERLVISYEEPNAPEREIVGVVRDVRNAGLTADPTPTMYVPFRQVPWNSVALVVRTGADPGTVTPAIRGVLRELDPDLPLYSVSTYEDILAQVVAQPRFRMQLLTTFAVVALLLAAVGVYGVMAYTVVQRRQEIGVRMALGAAPGAVRAMVLREALAVGLVGAGLGTLGALALSRVVASLLYQVAPTDPVTYAAVAGLLAAVTAAAGYLPAFRASRVDPVAALRD